MTNKLTCSVLDAAAICFARHTTAEIDVEDGLSFTSSDDFDAVRREQILVGWDAFEQGKSQVSYQKQHDFMRRRIF